MPPQRARGRGGPGDGGGGRGRGDGWGGRGRGGGGDRGGGRGGGPDRGGGRGGGDGFRGGYRGGGGGDRGGGGGGRGGGGDRGGGGGFRGGRGGGGRGGGPPPPQVHVPEYVPSPSPAAGGQPPRIAPGVKTIGVRRPTARGTLGIPLTVTTNNFVVSIPEATIHHYDVDIRTEKKMPARFNMDLIRGLQEHIAPATFSPRVVYDGQKNIFASRRLPLTGGDSQTFDVTLEPPREGGRPPKVYRVALKHVAEISPTLLARYQQGQQSYENMITTALTAINVVVRMEPITRYPHNARSFFTEKEKWRIGGGIELWRGYFQSVRPGLQSMLMNIDISTGAMFAPGPMIDVCHEILGNNSPNALNPRQGLSDRDRLKLQRFLSGVRFVTTHKDKSGRPSEKPKVLKKITSVSAAEYQFDGSDGKKTNVAQYFRSLGTNLQYPNYVCVETPSGAAFPIEICSIIPGQLMKKQLPPEVVPSVLRFSTKRPKERLDSIVAGHSVLQYGQSEFLQQFQMGVSQTPEKCLARVLPTPALHYGPGSRNRQLRPANGSWNMVNQKFFKGATVTGWALVVYDGRTIRQPEVDYIIRTFKATAELFGINGLSASPPVSYPPPQALNVHQHLHDAGNQVFRITQKPPSLIVVVIPDNSAELYQAIKHFGDVKRGVATQCLRSFKCKSADQQYYANVCLKVNAKLGGVNCTLDPQSQRFLSDAANPVMIIGADVQHPAPGSLGKGRPSFVAVVGSLDSTATHYSAVSQVQESRVEVIDDLESPVYELIGRHAWWKKEQEKKNNVYPKRIVYYRDGVSEGQFDQVLREELPAIQAACARHNIHPTVTVIIVGKRHHVRFFPTHGQADKSGNCPAGTVVDDVVGHPTEFDFYLQSHGGLLGTSRSAHYNVLYDENNFTPDSLQALSFSLCHVYARATRSVSIPAPVYYADIVCERSKNHYDPSVDFSSFDDSATATSGGIATNVQQYKDQFQPIHASMRYKMFFQ